MNKNIAKIEENEKEMASTKESLTLTQKDLDKQEERKQKLISDLKEKMKQQVDKMNDKLKQKNETIKDKEAHVINLQTEIENKIQIEQKLRAHVEQMNQ